MIWRFSCSSVGRVVAAGFPHSRRIRYVGMRHPKGYDLCGFNLKWGNNVWILEAQRKQFTNCGLGKRKKSGVWGGPSLFLPQSPLFFLSPARCFASSPPPRAWNRLIVVRKCLFSSWVATLCVHILQSCLSSL